MPNRVRILEVPESERAVLERRIRDRGAPARDEQRARIVLLSAQGQLEIATGKITDACYPRHRR